MRQYSENTFDIKKDVVHVDEIGQRSPPLSDEDGLEISKAEERKIIRKVDFRLVLTLGVVNCIALMDRLNISNAAIAGMTKDLKLNVGYRYSLMLLVFFITYIIIQPITTILCRKMGPRVYLSATAFSWGLLMLGFGFSKNWVTMIPLRLLLGLCEAGFIPGAIYLISTWYTRYEVQVRYSLFYLIGIVASAASGILAFGLMQMDGVGGLAGWRWIFIMEGILTCIIGFGAYFTLLDFPDQAVRNSKNFLNETQIQFLIDRIVRDRDDAKVEPFNFRKWAASAADPKVWAFAMIVFCGTTVSYSIAYFLPLILHNSMGFSIGISQCLVAPPFAFAAIFIYGSGWIGDKYRVRAPLLIFNAALGLIGLPIIGFVKTSGVRYFGVFLVTAGANALLPTSWAYQANNIRGQWKRAFSSALLVGFAGIGGIAGSLVFRAQDAPSYHPGIYATMACEAMIILIVIVQSIYFKIENRRADRDGKILEGKPDFRYTI